MTYIYVVFIGHHKERLISSIKFWQKEYAPSKFILIVGQEKTTGEQKAERIAKEIQGALETPLFSVTIEKISKLDLLKSINQLVKIILPFKEDGYKILLNVSGSLRIFTVTALTVAHFTESELVSVIPRYDEDFNEIGVERHIKIPTLPLVRLKPEQYNVLSAIGSGVESVEALVLKISPDCRKDEGTYKSERGRINYYLSSLEKSGFISRSKKGKNAQIQFTELGVLYSLISRGL